MEDGSIAMSCCWEKTAAAWESPVMHKIGTGKRSITITVLLFGRNRISSTRLPDESLQEFSQQKQEQDFLSIKSFHWPFGKTFKERNAWKGHKNNWLSIYYYFLEDRLTLSVEKKKLQGVARSCIKSRPGKKRRRTTKTTATLAVIIASATLSSESFEPFSQGKQEGASLPIFSLSV